MSEFLIETDAPGWTQFVTDFDKAWSSFNLNYNGLLAQRDFISQKHPQLLPEYNSLVNRANDIREKLVSLKNVRDTVGNWLSSVKSFFGLNALPLIPVAIGLGAAGLAIGAVGKWLSDTTLFADKINELKRLEDKGLTPQQAAAVIAKLSPQDENFSDLIKYGIILVGAIILLPILTKGLNK